MKATRIWLVLGGATTLAACGGASGPQTAGSVAPPAATPAPTHSFVNPTETKSYEGIGGAQHFAYTTQSNADGQSGQFYAADANTARDSGISVTYNPRDAIFELTIDRPKASVQVDAFRFQDPAHRTNFGGAAQPQAGVSELTKSQIQYLQAGSGEGTLLPASSSYAARTENSDYVVGDNGYTSTTQTLFYQKPGTTTQYVTYAGFVRNKITATEETDPNSAATWLKESYTIDRAVFAFGERTDLGAVPKTGSGTFTGDMIATLVFNPMLDTDPSYPTYFQWMEGTHSTTVDFASLKVDSSFVGTVFAPTRDAYTSFSGTWALPAGSTFSAHATATIDLVKNGGFSGSFDSAKFTRPGLSDFTLNIAGSSIDGAFFGPKAQEIGGGFRIVGGTPDERIDILGAFTGKQ